MRAVDQLQLQVASGSVTALLGANGAGKSSTIMCIAGHVEMDGGSIFYDGADIAALTPMARVTAGIGLVPEGRRLFSSLPFAKIWSWAVIAVPGKRRRPT